MAELSVWHALILGIVQGLSEWLPISSSGHLVIARQFLGVEAPLFFDLWIHIGTLAVVLFFLRRTVLDMLRALSTTIADRRATGSWREALWQHPERRLAVFVVVGTIPTAILGFTFEALLVENYYSIPLVGFALLATGTFLWFTQYAKPRPAFKHMSLKDALVVGFMQTFALIPGVSRSGATIGAALYSGVEREMAVRYSFLLSIPALAGATFFMGLEGGVGLVQESLLAYTVGLIAAMVVGYASLAGLTIIVKRKSLHLFSYYCWAVGGLLVGWVYLG